MCTVFGWKRHDDPDLLHGPCYPPSDSSINKANEMPNELSPAFGVDSPVGSGPALDRRADCIVTGFTDGTGTIVDKPIGWVFSIPKSAALRIRAPKLARPRLGWNGIGSMSRRRSFPSEGPRSNTPPKRQAPRPGSKPRPGPPRGPERNHQSGPTRHETPTAKPRPSKDGARTDSNKPDRLQKVLAHAGLGSRRGCEQLILQGRVTINGEVIRELGTRVDPAKARITVDGETIRLESMVYYAVNKPKGYVSTNSDPSGRPRVVDLLPEIPERVYTVGRLDEASTGLLILTNDGDLANQLAHPRYGVEKLYRALVAGLPTPEMMAKLTEGVWLSDGKVRAKRARIVSRQGQATTLELVLAEGKKREIRRMLSKLGHKVMSLNRIAVGPISLKGLSVGECRSLSRHEVDLLRKVASGESVAPPRFADPASNRPHGDSKRPHKPERGRAAQTSSHSAPRPGQDEGNLPPQRNPRHAQNERGPHASSKRPPHAGPHSSGPTSSSHRPPSPAALKSRGGPSKVPPKPRGKTNTPGVSRRPSPLSALPPEPLKPRRRIIGLELDSTVGRSRPDVAEGGGRKRPQARKRRPPGPILGKKRKPPSIAEGSNDDND
jgi:23S rRNA pseudouridine2605 synthase